MDRARLAVCVVRVVMDALYNLFPVFKSNTRVWQIIRLHDVVMTTENRSPSLSSLDLKLGRCKQPHEIIHIHVHTFSQHRAIEHCTLFAVPQLKCKKISKLKQCLFNRIPETEYYTILMIYFLAIEKWTTEERVQRRPGTNEMFCTGRTEDSIRQLKWLIERSEKDHFKKIGYWKLWGKKKK